MSENTLKLNNIKLNKKDFHKSKHPIEWSSVSVDQIVVSDKFKLSDEEFKHFIAIEKLKSLNQHVLSYLKWVDT